MTKHLLVFRVLSLARKWQLPEGWPNLQNQAHRRSTCLQFLFKVCVFGPEATKHFLQLPLMSTQKGTGPHTGQKDWQHQSCKWNELCSSSMSSSFYISANCDLSVSKAAACFSLFTRVAFGLIWLFLYPSYLFTCCTMKRCEQSTSGTFVFVFLFVVRWLLTLSILFFVLFFCFLLMIHFVAFSN